MMCMISTSEECMSNTNRGNYINTESTASNFMPVDRIKRRSSGSTCWMCLPHPRIKISDMIFFEESIKITQNQFKRWWWHQLVLGKCMGLFIHSSQLTRAITTKTRDRDKLRSNMTFHGLISSNCDRMGYLSFRSKVKDLSTIQVHVLGLPQTHARYILLVKHAPEYNFSPIIIKCLLSSFSWCESCGTILLLRIVSHYTALYTRG